MNFIFKNKEYQLTDWSNLSSPSPMIVRRLIDTTKGQVSNLDYIGFKFSESAIEPRYAIIASGMFKEILDLYFLISKDISFCHMNEIQNKQKQIDDFLLRVDKLKSFT